jgi:hypothetical protein
MKTKQKIDLYFKMIQGIKYENEHGGAYAYVQFLAYTRELISLLKPIKKVERHIEAIEGISWLFNEYLTTNFTYRQKVIFENKLNDLEVIFETIKNIIQDENKQNRYSESYIAKAA